MTSQVSAVLDRIEPTQYGASVLLPPEAAKSPKVHKIHILGEDERSKFIAHALSGLYEQVDMLGWSSRPPNRKYQYIQTNRPRPHRPTETRLVKMAEVTPPEETKDDTAHIDQLIVTGKGQDAVKALSSVKHRLSSDSTVCMLNDGMGYLEDVRRRVFTAPESRPDFLLGHLSHKLYYNRTYGSIHERSAGRLSVTRAPDDLELDAARRPRTMEREDAMISCLQEARLLQSFGTTYDEWLIHKLPSVIFDTVVETLCVLFSTNYQGLLQNPPALRLMRELIEEIVEILMNMPEIRGSSLFAGFAREQRLYRMMYGEIKAKSKAPSKLAIQVGKGRNADLRYYNGYFIRRAQKLGLDAPLNRMLNDAVAAAHSRNMEELNSHVRVVETELPADLRFRYRQIT